MSRSVVTLSEIFDNEPVVDTEFHFGVQIIPIGFLPRRIGYRVADVLADAHRARRVSLELGQNLLRSFGDILADEPLHFFTIRFGQIEVADILQHPAVYPDTDIRGVFPFPDFFDFNFPLALDRAEGDGFQRGIIRVDRELSFILILIKYSEIRKFRFFHPPGVFIVLEQGDPA